MSSELGENQTFYLSNYMRAIFTSALINNPMTIGGDETMYSRRKYKVTIFRSRGYSLEFCRETGHCFLYAVSNRTSETLFGCIKENILPGTTIISDSWNAYNGIKVTEGYNLASDSEPQWEFCGSKPQSHNTK